MARVLCITREREGMTSLRLRLPEGTDCRPGEDYLLKVPSLDGFATVQCAYGVTPGGGGPLSTVELLTHAPAGSVTAVVLNELLRPGDVLEVQGPAELFAGTLAR